MLRSGGDLQVHNCTFINSTISSDKASIDIFSSTFYNSNRPVRAVTVESLSVQNCNFFNNSISDGGILVISVPNVTVTYSNFTSNTIINDGGAIYLDRVSSFDISHNIFSSNTGRGVRMGICDGVIDYCSFSSNGGGLLAFVSNISITNSIFENNNASEGGAIKLSGKYTQVYNCRYVNIFNIICDYLT